MFAYGGRNSRDEPPCVEPAVLRERRAKGERGVRVLVWRRSHAILTVSSRYPLRACERFCVGETQTEVENGLRDAVVKFGASGLSVRKTYCSSTSSGSSCASSLCPPLSSSSSSLSFFSSLSSSSHAPRRWRRHLGRLRSSRRSSRPLAPILSAAKS